MASMWSELSEDLLRLIASSLVTLKDQVRFGCVCTSWRSVSPTIRRSYPWCLLHCHDDSEIREMFVCLHERKVHNLEFIPEVLDSSRFLGCSYSWLVATNDLAPTISLYNPFSKVLIALPPRNNFPDVRKYGLNDYGYPVYELEAYGRTQSAIESDCFVHKLLIHKLVLSSAPTKPNCMVAAIYGYQHYNLAYCKLGDERWTCINKGRMRYDDVIFHDQNLVYAVTITSHVHIFDLSSSSPQLVDTIQPPQSQLLPPQQEGEPERRRQSQLPPPQQEWEPERGRQTYLVKTSIGLLLVQRHWIWTGSLEEQNYCRRTKIFNLYMYEPSRRSWCKVESIGDNVLFLGLNTSVSIASSRLRGYKGNHIYFTDNLMYCKSVHALRGPYEIGVYDLDSTSVRCLQRYDFEKLDFNSPDVQHGRYDNDNHWLRPTPIWYIHRTEDFFEH